MFEICTETCAVPPRTPDAGPDIDVGSRSGLQSITVNWALFVATMLLFSSDSEM